MVNISDGMLHFVKQVVNAPRTNTPPDKSRYFLGDIWVKVDGRMFVWEGGYWRYIGVKLS